MSTRGRRQRPWIVWITVAVFAGVSPLMADDRVVIQLPSQSSRLTVTGHIEDFTGRELVLLAGAGGGVKRFAASEVIAVETTYTEPHRRAVEMIEKGEFAAASPVLDQAMSEEDRTWVRRDLLALQVQAALAQRNYRLAIQRFLSIAESDPITVHYRLIPLVWTSAAPVTLPPADLQMWLTAKEMSARLIAASWLLDSPRQDEGLRVLNELATESHPYIQRLAQAQLWRTRLESPDFVTAEVHRWEQLTDNLPAPLRAGPFFLVGRGYARQQDWLNAAAAWMWLPLRYETRTDLAAEAQWLAARAIAQSGDQAGAARLAWEVTTRYAHSPFASEARDWLKGRQ